MTTHMTCDGELTVELEEDTGDTGDSYYGFFYTQLTECSKLLFNSKLESVI